MVKFLQFVHADLPRSTGDFEDEFIKKLQVSIAQIKASREMGARYMVFEELLRDEFASGKAEGKAEDILSLLEECGSVDDELRSRIMAIKDLDKLKMLHRIAAKTDTVEQFSKNMNEIL